MLGNHWNYSTDYAAQRLLFPTAQESNRIPMNLLYLLTFSLEKLAILDIFFRQTVWLMRTITRERIDQLTSNFTKLQRGNRDR